MTPPEVQPVYLLLPSGGWGRAERPIADFVDAVAVDPVVAERVLLAVVECSTFVNEVSPLCAALEDAARVSLSGFEGNGYAAMFEGMAQLLEYDRYRLSADGVRVGRPLVVVVVHCAPTDDDDWQEQHLALVGADEHSAPVIASVATDPSARDFAEGIAFPPWHEPIVTNPVGAGESAAAIVVEMFARGIGVVAESADGLLNEGLVP